MRFCLHESYAPQRRLDLFRWLDENAILYHLTVDIRSHPAPHDVYNYEQTLQTVVLCLENDDDAVWLRLKYGYLPIPDDFNFFMISIDIGQTDERSWIT